MLDSVPAAVVLQSAVYSQLTLSSVSVCVSGLGSPFLTVRLHQSGVNSLDILETETPGRYLLASGGDDGSLQVCHVCVESSVAVASVRISARFAVLSAHAALLTGLRFLTPDLLVSASVDQRVALWRLGRAGLSWQGARFCHVADVAGLEAWQREEDRDTFLAVCGQGLQILRLGHRERLGETGRDWERGLGGTERRLSKDCRYQAR